MGRLLLGEDFDGHCGYIVRTDPGKLADPCRRIYLALFLDGVDVVDLCREVLCPNRQSRPRIPCWSMGEKGPLPWNQVGRSAHQSAFP